MVRIKQPFERPPPIDDVRAAVRESLKPLNLAWKIKLGELLLSLLGAAAWPTSLLL
jgi:hypothetical protein